MNIRGKKGGSEDVTMSEVVYIVVIVMVFITLIAFVYKSASLSIIVEEMYAKKVALLIDEGMPGMEMKMEMSELYTFWVGSKMDLSKFNSESITINQEENLVIVKTTSSGYYAYPFSNEYKFNYAINVQTKGSEKEAVLILNFDDS